MIALAVAKINDKTTFKDGCSAKKKVFVPRKKVENMGGHAETIKSQQLQVKRVLDKILTKIPAERHGMELLLLLHLRYDMGTW